VGGYFAIRILSYTPFVGGYFAISLTWQTRITRMANKNYLTVAADLDTGGFRAT
jgi:hypothetical protein